VLGPPDPGLDAAVVLRRRGGGVEERHARLVAMQGLLGSLARRIGPALELQPVLREAMAAMRSLVDFRGGTVGLVDERGVYVAAADPPVSEDVAAARVPVGTGLAGRCVATAAPIYSPDIGADDRVDQGLRNTGTNRGVCSYLGVPLVCLGEVIGVLQVDSAEEDAFDLDDLHVLEGIATQVAGAIESARHHELARRLDDARSMFISRVSHELRTPITILAGLSQTVLANPERFRLDADLTDVLRRIDAASARLGGLVDELITVGSLETGLLLGADPADVRLREVLDRVRDDAESPHLVEVRGPDDLRAEVDATLLRQCLQLLVHNATSYAGGAELEAQRSDAGVEVRVVDHGPGIPDAEKSAVFERFHRGAHQRPGWGLGLSTARQLATTMGVELRLADTPGGGATFTLTLPAPTARRV
jgi:signal transduction histidine kinase